MKSIFATILIFAALMGAIQFGVFDVLSSSYVFYLSAGILIVVFIIAFKVLGNPFAQKDERDDKE